MSSGPNARLGKLIAGVGGFAFFAGIVFVGWQTLTWLHSGHWYSISLRTALIGMRLSPPRFSWVGVQEAWDTGADWPLSFYIFLLSAAIMASGNYIAQKQPRPRRDAAQRPRRYWKV